LINSLKNFPYIRVISKNYRQFPQINFATEKSGFQHFVLDKLSDNNSPLRDVQHTQLYKLGYVVRVRSNKWQSATNFTWCAVVDTDGRTHTHSGK